MSEIYQAIILAFGGACVSLRCVCLLVCLTVGTGLTLDRSTSDSGIRVATADSSSSVAAVQSTSASDAL